MNRSPIPRSATNFMKEETKEEELARLRKQANYPNSIGEIARWLLEEYERDSAEISSSLV